jgi:DHA1 family tetracycline resistance protein-like MFS transporter
VHATSARPRALTFLYLTVVLDVLAFGIVVPVVPRLILSFLGNDTARASEVGGWFGSAYALATFLCAPLLGALSDRFGRRPVILVALFGLAADYLIMAWAPTLAWLWVGRITSGICGATYSTAGAYIADVTPPEKRASAFGLIGAAWGLGFVLGPAMGGLLGTHDPRLPFWVAGGLTVANALWGLVALPESLPPERRSPLKLARANPVGSLVLLRSHPELFALALVQTCYLLSHQVLPSVYVLYVAHRYGWDMARTSFVLALVGIASSIVQGGLIRPIVLRLGERAAAMAGLACGALSSVLYAAAPGGGWFLLGIPFGSLAGLYNPSAQGLMSQRVGVEEQGKLQGALTSLQGLTGLVGPTLFGTTFAWAIGAGQPAVMAGAPFYLAAAILGTGMLLLARATRAAARPERQAPP